MSLKFVVRAYSSCKIHTIVRYSSLTSRVNKLHTAHSKLWFFGSVSQNRLTSAPPSWSDHLAIRAWPLARAKKIDPLFSISVVQGLYRSPFLPFPSFNNGHLLTAIPVMVIIERDFHLGRIKDGTTLSKTASLTLKKQHSCLRSANSFSQTAAGNWTNMVCRHCSVQLQQWQQMYPLWA